MGDPVLPLAVPGAAVSPGRSTCSLARAPAFTVMLGLVLAVFVPSVTLVAVRVAVPAVFRVREKEIVPATNAALAGGMALGSEAEMLTVWEDETRFQLASTALTLMRKALPAD